MISMGMIGILYISCTFENIVLQELPCLGFPIHNGIPHEWCEFENVLCLGSFIKHIMPHYLAHVTFSLAIKNIFTKVRLPSNFIIFFIETDTRAIYYCTCSRCEGHV